MYQLFLLLLALARVSCAFKFLSVGDWGDKEFREKLSENFDVQGKDAPLVLLLGDNFYERGVTSEYDAQWETKYQASFRGKNLQSAKFLVASGNHDYYGNVSAQIAYKDPTKRWTFPQLYHARRFEQNGIKVMFVMLDTWRLQGGDTLLGHNPVTGKTWLRSREAVDDAVATGEITPNLAEYLRGKHKLARNMEDQVSADHAQLAWLRAVLTSPAALESDWLFVCGHYPVRSATLKEHGDTEYLVKKLEPMLFELGVDAYFSGHDHVLQVIESRRGLHYYGPGAGARKHRYMDVNYKGLKAYSANAFGFMRHEVTKTKMTTTLIDDTGSELYKIVQESQKTKRARQR